MEALDHALTRKECARAIDGKPPREAIEYLLDCIDYLDPILKEDLGPLSDLGGTRVRQVAYLMWMGRGRTVSQQALCDLFEGCKDPLNNVTVYISLVRNALAGTGYHIKTLNRVGYRLEKAEKTHVFSDGGFYQGDLFAPPEQDQDDPLVELHAGHSVSGFDRGAGRKPRSDFGRGQSEARAAGGSRWR